MIDWSEVQDSLFYLRTFAVGVNGSTDSGFKIPQIVLLVNALLVFEDLQLRVVFSDSLLLPTFVFTATHAFHKLIKY